MFGQQTYSPPEILEPIDGQLGIPDGVLDVLMTEVMLERASIVPIVRKLVSAGVPEHVRVNSERHLRDLAEALDEPVETYGAHLTGARAAACAGLAFRRRGSDARLACRSS